MAGEIQLNGTTALTESGGEVTLNNVDSATNRQNLGLEIGVDVQQFDADTTKNDVANTFTANQIISVTDNTNAALRVTQLGTGNALVIEDSTNPDSTPFLVDSSGNVLIGTTSTDQASSVGSKFVSNGRLFQVSSHDSNAQENFTMYSTGASAYRFYVDWGGTIHATNTTISAISDQRFKENIRDLDVGLDAIMQLKPRKFDWKEGKGKNIQNDRGFIAQEFGKVFPDLIDEWKDPAPVGEEPYKSVRQDLIPVLVKAIQEQQTFIESQQSQIDALNARIESLETT